MIEQPRGGFWRNYRRAMGAAFVWGLFCALGGGQHASDWPPNTATTSTGPSMWEVPIVTVAWMAFATVLYLAAHLRRRA